jgi:hypothetical protein
MKSTEVIHSSMNRSKLRRLFKRYHGSIKRVADELAPPVSSESVSRWLKGQTHSVRIETAVLHEAEKLLAEEAKIEAARAKVAKIDSSRPTASGQRPGT